MGIIGKEGLRILRLFRIMQIAAIGAFEEDGDVCQGRCDQAG
jgi:hypothetical protein